MKAKRLVPVLAVTLLTVGAPSALAQPGEPAGPHTSVEWRIWAYSTAAPSFISENATVEDAGNNVLREGTNGWTCLPINPRGMADPEKGWKDPHEAMPVCGDEEGFKWITAYVSGETPQLDRDTFMWMLHGDMGEDNTTPLVMSKSDAENPVNWIESGPHLMLMPKDPKSLDKFTSDFMTGSPYTMFRGTDYAHLMIPMEDYYDYHK